MLLVQNIAHHLQPLAGLSQRLINGAQRWWHNGANTGTRCSRRERSEPSMGSDCRRPGWQEGSGSLTASSKKKEKEEEENCENNPERRILSRYLTAFRQFAERWSLFFFFSRCGSVIFLPRLWGQWSCHCLISSLDSFSCQRQRIGGFRGREPR